VALLNLAEYFRNPHGRESELFLESAAQHARHAVSIELHPFPLSTLGKVLMTQMLLPGQDMKSLFDEAFGRLGTAIDLESSWSRSAVQPYVSLFSGTIKYLERKGALANRQIDALKSFLAGAQSRFSRDKEIQDLVGKVSKQVGEL
jgi:hypothetical protein